MEVLVTTGAIRCAKLQSNSHHQQTNIQLFLQTGCPSCCITNSVRALNFSPLLWLRIPLVLRHCWLGDRKGMIWPDKCCTSSPERFFGRVTGDQTYIYTSNVQNKCRGPLQLLSPPFLTTSTTKQMRPNEKGWWKIA